MTTQTIDTLPEEPTKMPRGANSVIVMSTLAFTLMFAAWMMFGILGIPIRDELGLTDVQLSWISAAAILNGSLWRLPAGIMADRYGGRIIMVVLLVVTAAFSYMVALADSYAMILILAFMVGFAGNSFSSGVAWNSAWVPKDRQGLALGIFGAGNVGASVTKFIAPVLITATAGATYFGFIQGGWRLIPVIYSALLIVTAVAVLMFAPRQDRKPGADRTFREELKPLKQMRVWRFSLYYVAVFGAYVALAAWLPKYYVDNFGTTLTTAALLTALYIFPASLLRPLGGWFSDRIGARKVMYWTFAAMIGSTFLLMMPNGHIVVQVSETVAASGAKEVLPYSLGLVPFTILVFILGCAMGIGKAAVYKHIPEYFPGQVGSVGGLVGMFGGLGGFLLPPLFAYTTAWTGLPSATFFVLFILSVVCAIWMHLTVVSMLHEKSPELSDHFETPPTEENAAS